ncbi:MAG: TRAM domain-containing protein [Armatimonadetes bacterium]|nr:TRAM domain-containing protein [Armatimonadota bacterium]MDI9583025.1 TRAM domain-containing protein [Acidobacteriota bacterium]
MILLRGLWSLFVAAMTFVGVILANNGANIILRQLDLQGAESRDEIMFRIGFSVVGGLIGFLFGLMSFRKLISWVTEMEKVPLLDKIAAVAGVLIGLTVAILFTTPFANSENWGLPIRIAACVVGIILGIGFSMSAKEQILYIFPSLAPEKHVGPARVEPCAPKMLDTNIIIDGRIADIAAVGFLEGRILIPGFVLQELRHIAGSADGLKRARGRRGLDMLNRLKQVEGVETAVFEDYPADLDMAEEVDQRLVSLADLVGATVVTNDYSVNEIAKLKGVRTINVNELANAMKPVFLPGENMTVTVVKEGREAGQGVAYLDDGTMVVVEGGVDYLGQMIPVVVTSVLQTTAGKMIFSDLVDENGNSASGSTVRKGRDRK